MAGEILLTGGSGYIGAAIASHLRTAGHEVDAPLTQRLNVLDDAGVESYVRGKEYGAMILAHGNLGHVGRLKDAKVEHWQRAMEQHVFGAVSLIHHARVDGPIIVFGGASGGRIPLPERSSYAAAKAALNALIITGAGEGLKIFGIAPGPQPSRHVHWLLNHSQASERVKAEVEAEQKNSVGLGSVMKIIDELLAGHGEPGHFYSARGP